MEGNELQKYNFIMTYFELVFYIGGVKISLHYSSSSVYLTMVCFGPYYKIIGNLSLIWLNYIPSSFLLFVMLVMLVVNSLIWFTLSLIFGIAIVFIYFNVISISANLFMKDTTLQKQSPLTTMEPCMMFLSFCHLLLE